MFDQQEHKALEIVHYLRRVRGEDGGVVRAVLDLSSLMAEHGHRVTVITRNAQDCPPSWSSSHGGVGSPSILHLPSLRWRELKTELVPLLARADVLHVHSLWGLDDACIARLAKRLNTPYVLSLHGVLDRWCLAQSQFKKATYLRTVAKPFLGEASAVHCTADEELGQARLSATLTHAVVIPYALDLSPFLQAGATAATEETVGQQKTKRLLFLSRVHYKKGLHHLIRAVATLSSRGIDVTLDVAGQGELEYKTSVMREIEALGLEGRVRFLGHVAEPERSRLLADSDVMVLPTSQENFGLVLVEAIASGTPVVTTTGVDIHPDLMRTGAARIVDANELPDAFVDDLANAIEEVLTSVAGRENVIQDAQCVVKAWLDPARLAIDYYNLYIKAIRTTNSDIL